MNSLTWGWAPHVLSIELKKAFSYRANFWIQFLIGTTADLLVSYFLWKAIFSTRAVSEMEGFSFHGIVYYYFFATFATRISRGAELGYLAQDIYDGGLTRYLLYPLPFIGFKYVTHFSQQLLAIVQLVIGFAVVVFLLGLPPDQKISLGSFLAGTATCVLVGYLQFMIASCIELVAFWQDVIWSLLVMLRFVVMFLGGAMIPLSFFPAWGARLVAWMPFQLLVSFPARTFLGQVSFMEWLQELGLLLFWSLIFSFILSRIWARGTKQYSGVGI